MYEVATRDIPARSVLSVKRSVQGIDGTWAFGKEFISILRNHDLPRVEGRAGAFLLHLVERGQRRQRRPVGVVPAGARRSGEAARDPGPGTCAPHSAGAP
jgi:hypothetical protein